LTYSVWWIVTTKIPGHHREVTNGIGLTVLYGLLAKCEVMIKMAGYILATLILLLTKVEYHSL